MTLYIILTLLALYALYVGGRLKRTEAHVEILRAALDRHLATGADYQSRYTVIDGGVV